MRVGVMNGTTVLMLAAQSGSVDAVTRLLDLGVPPYLITSTLLGVMAQRLVRKICTNCRTEYEPPLDQLMELKLKPEDVQDATFTITSL